MNDELISNTKAFDREKYTLQTLIKKKNVQLDRLSASAGLGLETQIPHHIENELPISGPAVLRQEPSIETR